MDHLANLILTRPKALVAAVLTATAVLAIPASRLQIDSSADIMLGRDDPELVYHRRFVDRFGFDELVVIAFKAPRLFKRPMLEMIERISNVLAAIQLEGEGILCASDFRPHAQFGLLSSITILIALLGDLLLLPACLYIFKPRIVSPREARA